MLICFPPWLILFIRRKDLRKEILYMSILGGLFGPFLEFFYVIDYWKPELITFGKIGVEDILFGFFITGISASIYEATFRRNFTLRKKRKYTTLFLILPLTILFFSFLAILVFVLKINSVYSTIILFIAMTIVIILLRKDLIIDTFISGLLMGIFILLGYTLLLRIFPDMINKFWMLDNLSGWKLWNIPIEEYLWFFSTGLVFGPLYEFLLNIRFKRQS